VAAVLWSAIPALTAHHVVGKHLQEKKPGPGLDSCSNAPLQRRVQQWKGVAGPTAGGDVPPGLSAGEIGFAISPKVKAAWRSQCGG